MEPIRHALGALLLEQGHVEEAEAVYREDLRLHPDNGWALTGLAECLRRSGREEEAKAVEAKLAVAWADSDIRPKVSCFCRKGA
jgi:Flp pilus assembly protein TadD